MVDIGKICHECSAQLSNPFYILGAVMLDKENKRIAFSRVEANLCVEDYYNAKLLGNLYACLISGGSIYGSQ